MTKSHDGIPAYIRIEEDVIKKIESGEWAADSFLPPETELAKLWDVHRLTLRAAFTSLEQRGYIHRVQGKGTFVRDIKKSNRQYLPLDKLRTFQEKKEQAHGFMDTKVLVFKEIPAKAEIAHILKIEKGDPLFYIERVRSYANVPTVYEQTYTPKALAQGISAADLEQSKFGYFASQGMAVAQSERTLRGIFPSRAICQYLNISRYAIVMHMESLTSLKDGTILELVHSYYNQDVYHFSVTARP